MGRSLKVSVGICAYNEGKNIGGLIENLLNQPLRGYELIEVIVIASGCTDETVSIVQAWCDRDRRVKLIVKTARNGKVAAINKLLRTYQGDILVHVSADLLLSREALQPLLDHFNDPSIGGVSGHQIPVQEGGFMDKVNALVWGLHNETQRYYNHRGTGQHLGGDLFSIRSGICSHVPEDIVNDDAFMGIECKRKGYRVHFEDKALAFFQGPRNISDFLAQRRRIVYGHLKVKKETGITPLVLEMCPLKDKFVILRRWIQKRRRLSLHFIAACLLGLYANILARCDMLKKNNPHKIWKIAATTKMLPINKAAGSKVVQPDDSFSMRPAKRGKALVKSRKMHKAYREDFESDFRLRELRRTADLVNPEKCKILDVGCGNGLIQQFLPNNMEYTGVDFNDDYLTILWMGKSKTNKIVAEATYLPFQDSIFDILLNLQVVEHLPEPLQGRLISELYRVLKKGGQLIISTPNLGTWFNPCEFVPPHNPKHHHCVTYSELSNLLSQVGFKNVRRFGFDVVVEYPYKIFKFIPYTLRKFLAGHILGLEKHLIVQASKTTSYPRSFGR